jgi:hypothetical protein
MDRRKLNFIIDILMTICFFIAAFIGVLMGLVVGKGRAVPQSDKYFLGLHRHEWGDIHWVFSIALLVCFVIHLVLHWQWIKRAFQKYIKINAVFGTIIIIFIAAVIIWVTMPIVKTGKYNENGYMKNNPIIKKVKSKGGNNVKRRRYGAGGTGPGYGTRAWAVRMRSAPRSGLENQKQ